MTTESPHTLEGDAADLQPARAIRRALADGGFKARDVDLVAAWAAGPRARQRAEQAVARGLGRFAAGVTVVVDDSDVAGRCKAAIASGEAKLAVALTIDLDGVGVALAFGRPT